ncbi:MAG: hypothetical protein Q8R46_10955 [Nitrosomonas sp.]|uniref:hypothetical protein n=1 Tax=Nitrosomonas sp. TaxID=42353 RepID=UPI002732EF28|nr:hypothetical protein [Nitrosomonas sp.]MDP3663905.1 hypothetical protein [Nitrosomonas sp.]
MCRTIIDGELAKVEIYKAQLQGEETKAQVNTTLVQQYKAQVEAGMSQVEIYRAQVSAAQTLVQLEQAKIGAAGEQIKAYVAQVNAETAKVEAYKATVEGEVTKVQAYKAKVDAFSAKVGAQAEQARAEISRYSAMFQAKAAEWDGYRALVATEGERIRALGIQSSTLLDGYLNKLVIDLKGVTEEQLTDAFEGLQADGKANTPEGRLAQRTVKKYLRELFGYMEKAGVELGDLGADYFPRVWDSHYISKHQDSFMEMLRKYGLDEGVMHKIIANEGSEQTVESERPANQHTRERVLSMISAEDAAPFVSKDFWRTLEVYTTQATRRAEWARRFGGANERLGRLMEEAQDQGATEEQLDTARTYIKGVNGTLGDDLNPSARRLMGNLIVYQNIRLLPMAVFSSLIDPMGVMVRGGTVGDAWDTFKRGIKELPKSWQKDPKFDAQHELAETLGVIDDATMSNFMSTQFTQGMVDGAARKINDAFFKYNFMEGFNRSMRVGAAQAAVRFVQRHATNPTQHSQRYLSELGLKPSDIVMRDGKLLVTEADGLTPKQAAQVRRAVNLWVDGAVLRPDAADRPIWMNDPHWALVSHLKSFVFAFHHTILKRVKHEIDHGNYTPAMVLAGYVPMMLAADLTKDMIANGGDEPEWKQGWTAADHVGYAIQRAGILGVGQFAVDAYGDVKNGGMGIGALAGPTVDQLTDAVQVIGGRQEFGAFTLRSMPANSLYRGYLDGTEATE